MRSPPAVASLSNGSYSVMVTNARASYKYRYRSASYRIRVDNSAGTGRGVRSVELDRLRLSNNTVALEDDSRTHEVCVKLG
jgi:hypothetical protein